MGKRERRARRKTRAKSTMENAKSTSTGVKRVMENELDLQNGAGIASPQKGYLGKILARDVAVGQPIAVTAQKGQLEVALEVSKKEDHWIADKKRFKINIDAIFKHLGNKGGIAVLARDSLGRMMGVDYKVIYPSSALEAEAKAALLAVQMAEKLKLEDYVVETTSRTLKRHIEEKKMRDGCPGLLAGELKYLSGKSQIFWSRVNLNANQAVRFLSRGILEGRIDANPSNLMQEVPSILAGLLFADETLAFEGRQ